MTRLFRFEEDGSYTEVDTGAERLSGLQDALLIAEKKGDGKYAFDYQNGTYQTIDVAGGKVQRFEHDAVKNGELGADFDRRQMGDTVTASVSQFGTIFPADGVVGREPDGRAAVEDM